MGIQYISGTGYNIADLQNKKIRLRYFLPIIATENSDGWVIECPAIDEYGIGGNYDEAYKDLLSSINDFYFSVKNMLKRGHKMQHIWDNLTKWIEEV